MASKQSVMKSLKKNEGKDYQRKKNKEARLQERRERQQAWQQKKAGEKQPRTWRSLYEIIKGSS